MAGGHQAKKLVERNRMKRKERVRGGKGVE
jgi:hypothetical protein